MTLPVVKEELLSLQDRSFGKDTNAVVSVHHYHCSGSKNNVICIYLYIFLVCNNTLNLQYNMWSIQFDIITTFLEQNESDKTNHVSYKAKTYRTFILIFLHSIIHKLCKTIHMSSALCKGKLKILFERIVICFYFTDLNLHRSVAICNSLEMHCYIFFTSFIRIPIHQTGNTSSRLGCHGHAPFWGTWKTRETPFTLTAKQMLCSWLHQQSIHKGWVLPRP